MVKKLQMRHGQQTDLLNLLTEILPAIKEKNHLGNGLLSGLAGQLLLLFQLEKHQELSSRSPIELSDLETLIGVQFDRLQTQLSAYLNDFSLSSGLCGQGWLLEYLNQAQGDDYDPQFCAQIDSLLLGKLSAEAWQGELELVLGLSGFAVYAGRRHLKTDSHAFFERLLTQFEHAATRFEDGSLSWSQPAGSVYRFNTESPESQEFNLGLAHGVPGIIAAILPSMNIPHLKARASDLLRHSCDWLVGQLGCVSSGASCYSCSSNDSNPSRLAWCYGDLTIALTLARVGQVLNENSYVMEARKIALHAANRNVKEAMVYDAGICHGSAGLVLIFLLLNEHLNESALHNAAQKWFDYTLALFHQKGIEGLYMYDGRSGSYVADSGFLMGYSGIGLCLIAALTGDADWADCLLMA